MTSLVVETVVQTYLDDRSDKSAVLKKNFQFHNPTWGNHLLKELSPQVVYPIIY